MATDLGRGFLDQNGTFQGCPNRSNHVGQLHGWVNQIRVGSTTATIRGNSGRTRALAGFCAIGLRSLAPNGLVLPGTNGYRLMNDIAVLIPGGLSDRVALRDPRDEEGPRATTSAT